MTRRTQLYRFFSDSGQLLYVGISFSAAERFAQHRDGSGFWPEVKTIQLENYASRELALAAESRAIWLEKPLHNRQGSARPPDQSFRRADVSAAVPAPAHGAVGHTDWVIIQRQLDRLAYLQRRGITC